MLIKQCLQYSQCVCTCYQYGISRLLKLPYCNPWDDKKAYSQHVNGPVQIHMLRKGELKR